MVHYLGYTKPASPRRVVVMDQLQLSSIFDKLVLGEDLPPWDYDDQAQVQSLLSPQEFWARRVDAEGRFGPWVLLPAPDSQERFERFCPTCGNWFDTRDQDQVVHHGPEPHES